MSQQVSLKGISKKALGSIDLETFKMIQDFINDIVICGFAEGRHECAKSIQMYSKVINSMKFKDDDLIIRHVNIVQIFCQQNKDAILNKDRSLIKNRRMVFSDKIFIDIEYLMDKADKESKKTIWDYLLVFSARLDKSSEACQVLASQEDVKVAPPCSTDNNNNNVLAGFNPQDVLKMIDPGMMSSILGTITGGGLDIQKLMRTVTGAVKEISSEFSNIDDPNIQSLLKNINNSIDTIDEENG